MALLTGALGMGRSGMKKSILTALLVLALSACQQGNPTEPPVPPSPSALTGSLQGSTALLNWTQCPDTNFLRYRLYRSSRAGIQQRPDLATVLLVTENRSQTSFQDEQLPSGHWYYAVETENLINLTSWSNEVHLAVTDGKP